MNIEEMIYNGASEEEIQEALNQIKAEKARQEEALRQAQNDEKEELKAEARAHFINAMICYTEAFDLLPEGEELDEEDIASLEKVIIQLEGMIPMYMKLLEMREAFEDGDMDLLGGLFGGGR